jgi:hypothetical protein
MALKFIKLPNGKTITEDLIVGVELIEEAENNIYDIAKKKAELDLIEKELEEKTSDKKINNSNSFIMKMIKAKQIMESVKVKSLIEDLERVHKEIETLTEAKTGKVSYKIEYLDKKNDSISECQTKWFATKEEANNWMTKIGIEVLSL